MNTSSTPHTPSGLPPLDEESEKIILGILLADPKRIFDVRELLDEGDAFYFQPHMDVYRALIAVYDSGATVRPLTVIQHLKRKGEEKLLEQVNIGALLNIGGTNTGVAMETALHLRELYISRLAYGMARKIERSVMAHEGFDTLITHSREMAELVTSKMSVGRKPTPASVVRDTMRLIEEASQQSDGMTGVPTGLHKLDKLTGGWQPSDLVYIGARTAMGKSAVLLHHLKAAAEAGHAAGMLSYESNETDLMMRLNAEYTGIPYNCLRRGRYIFDDGATRSFTQDEWKLLHEAAAYLESLPLYLLSMEGNNDIATAQYQVLEWQQKYDIKLVGIDYVQLMGDRTIKSSSEQEVISSVSKKLKVLNARTGVPQLNLCQLNRKLEEKSNKHPSLTDLRSTGQLEQDGSIVVGLYRDDAYKLEAARNDSEGGQFRLPKFDHTLDYELLKFRNGQAKMLRLHLNVAVNQLRDDAPYAPPVHTPPIVTTAGVPYRFPEKAALVPNSFRQLPVEDTDFTDLN